MTNRRIRQTGAALVELTCAFAVLSVGAFGAMHMQFVAMDKIRTLQEYAIAERVLQNEMETLRAQPFEDIVPGGAQPFHSETPLLARLADASAELTIVDQSADTRGLIEVRAKVSWTGEHGRRIEKELVSLIANRE